MKLRNLIIAGAIAGTAFAGLTAYGNSPQVQKQIAADKAEAAAKQAEAQQRVRINEAKEQFANCIDGNRYSCKSAVKNNLLNADQLKQSEAKLVVLDKQFEQLQAETKAKAKAKADAQAKFKAEGWWEEQPGIFVRWCGDGSKHSTCPGPSSNGYSDYTWRAMVWCKQRACGDIYARLNILNGGTVVGWTNDSAYGGYGQKVVLTFGSSTAGLGQIVEFNARG